MQKTTRDLGAQGEELALEFLEQQGLILLDRNYYCDMGELDLVMQDDDTTVFIEVKAAYNQQDPFENLHGLKIRSLLRTITDYLYKSKLGDNWRIDVVGITYLEGEPSFEWVRDVELPL